MSNTEMQPKGRECHSAVKRLTVTEIIIVDACGHLNGTRTGAFECAPSASVIVSITIQIST